MPGSILHPYDAAGTTRLDARYTNVGGGLITGVLFEGSGREIADTYTLTLSAASGSTATVTVTCAAGSANPYHNQVFPGIVFNGGTERALVPGITITKKNGAVANGNSSTVTVGIPGGVRIAGNPTGTQLKLTSTYATPGETPVASGQPGILFKSLVTNEGADAVASAAIKRYPVAKLVNKASPWGFEYVETVSATPFERVAAGVLQPNKFTFANLSGGHIDVLLDEGSGTPALFDVIVIGGSPTPVASSGLLADGSTRYQIVEAGSHVEEMIFCIATTADDTSAENVLIWNADTAWAAPDVAGAPGTYSLVSAVLTQSGQPSGVVNAAGSVAWWGKVDVSALDLPDFFQGDYQIEYAKTGVPAWFA